MVIVTIGIKRKNIKLQIWLSMGFLILTVNMVANAIKKGKARSTAIISQRTEYSRGV